MPLMNARTLRPVARSTASVNLSKQPDLAHARVLAHLDEAALDRGQAFLEDLLGGVLVTNVLGPAK